MPLLFTVASIRPSSFSSASHQFTLKTHSSSVCLSLIIIVSTNHDGLSPSLSCSKVRFFRVPNDSLVARTNPLTLPRANSSHDSPLIRRGILLCSHNVPFILRVTLAVVPEFLQIPVLMIMS